MTKVLWVVSIKLLLNMVIMARSSSLTPNTLTTTSQSEQLYNFLWKIHPNRAVIRNQRNDYLHIDLTYFIQCYYYKSEEGNERQSPDKASTPKIPLPQRRPTQKPKERIRQAHASSFHGTRHLEEHASVFDKAYQAACKR